MEKLRGKRVYSILSLPIAFRTPIFLSMQLKQLNIEKLIHEIIEGDRLEKIKKTFIIVANPSRSIWL